MSRAYGLFIDGAWVEAGTAGRLERFHPATGEQVATYGRGNAADIDVAVQAAHRALQREDWAALSQRERSQRILNAAEAILRSEEQLAQVEADETGKPLAQARDEIRAGAELWKFAASALRTQSGLRFPDLSPQHSAYTVIEPVGVVALILPWNFPFIVSAERLPFMLAAGCTVVVKPSEFAAGTSLLLGELLLEAGIPAGVYNVVTGLGLETGAPLVEHPQVAMVSFTGSTDNGQMVMAAASRTLKRVSLELGGKSPVLVFADADFEQAADAVIKGFTHNAGQCCIATSRLLVERSASERFKALLVEKLRRLPLTQAVATQAQYDKVCSYVALGKATATTVYAGDSVPATGLFVAPAVFEHESADSAVVREEIFGPVLSLLCFDSEAEAIAMANDTRFGLAAAVWSSDLERAMRVAGKIRAGRLWVNAAQENFPELPVGGYGASGIGREAGAQGILAYSEIKSVIVGNAATGGRK